MAVSSTSPSSKDQEDVIKNIYAFSEIENITVDLHGHVSLYFENTTIKLEKEAAYAIGLFLYRALEILNPPAEES